jgi:hypothetical protein
MACASSRADLFSSPRARRAGLGPTAAHRLAFLMHPQEFHHERTHPSRSPGPAHHPRTAGARPALAANAARAAVAAAPVAPQRAQDGGPIHRGAGRQHRARGPAAEPHRHPGIGRRALRGCGRRPPLRRPQAAGQEAPHRQGLGGALPSGGRQQRSHRQPYRERAARGHAPGRPVRSLRCPGGRGAPGGRHRGRLRRHAPGGAAPPQARQCLAPPDGRLPRRRPQPRPADGAGCDRRPRRPGGRVL